MNGADSDSSTTYRVWRTFGWGGGWGRDEEGRIRWMRSAAPASTVIAPNQVVMYIDTDAFANSRMYNC